MNHQREYLPLLNLFRISIVCAVLLFHAVIHNFWNLPKDTNLYINLSVGAIFMDTFFILSGFILYYLYGKKIDFDNKKNIKQFYIKRFLRIYPQYLIYTIVVMLYEHSFDWKVVPAEIFCLQSFFYELFGKFGNGGTWFISCLVYAYLLFPVMKTVVNSHTRTIPYIFGLVFIVIYISIISACYKVRPMQIYINPLYRILEFMIGMYTGKLVIENFFKRNNLLYSVVAISCIVSFYFVIPFLYDTIFFNNIKYGNNYIFYSCLSVPISCTLIYTLSLIRNSITEKLSSSKMLKILSELSFSFYLWQGMAQRLAKSIHTYTITVGNPYYYQLCLGNTVIYNIGQMVR